MLLKSISYSSRLPLSCGWTWQHKISPLTSPLSLLPQPHYLLPSQCYSYQLDKEPEGENCQMSVFDRWDLCVRLVYISLISHPSSFFSVWVSYPDCPEDKLNVSVWRQLKKNKLLLLSVQNVCISVRARMHPSVHTFSLVHACAVCARVSMHTWVFVDTVYPDEIAPSKKDRGDFTVVPSADKSFELCDCNINSSRLHCCQEVAIRGIPNYEDEVYVCVRLCVWGFKANTWGFPPHTWSPHLFCLIGTITWF